MTSFIPTLVAAALLAAPAPVPEEKPKAPESPAPEFATVSETDAKEGTCTLRQIQVVPVAVEEVRTRVVNGVAIAERVKTLRHQNQTIEFRVLLRGSQILDGEGKAVAEDDAWKRLTANTTIALVRNGGKIDPAYLRLFKKETLVIILAADAPPAPAAKEQIK
jgi:hypothetical protein